MGKMSGKMKIVIAALSVAVVLCGLLIAWLLIAGQTKEGQIARVYQDGVVVYEVDLSTVTDPFVYRIEGEDGAYNDILFEPGRVSVQEANCPDQVCVETGVIDSGLLPIICLPHKVLVKIE